MSEKMEKMDANGEHVELAWCLKPWGTAAAGHPFKECGHLVPCPAHDDSGRRPSDGE